MTATTIKQLDGSVELVVDEHTTLEAAKAVTFDRVRIEPGADELVVELLIQKWLTPIIRKLWDDQRTRVKTPQGATFIRPEPLTITLPDCMILNQRALCNLGRRLSDSDSE